MKKLRLYLETTIPNYLFDDDKPEKQCDTWRLWNEIKSGEYEVVVGSAVFDEIDSFIEQKAPKKLLMANELKLINYEFFAVNDDVIRLANEYINIGGLKPSSETDAIHIASATLANCDFILSWNFAHIVNMRAMVAVDAVNTREVLKQVKILSPTIFLGEE
ncbi:MAG: PIN domain-containing protein [Planctomycetota bacterium]|jgi:predicted nucleic acid-binding protein|nr:PIN domain-containing protein [Planctomycetota bacterium]